MTAPPEPVVLPGVSARLWVSSAASTVVVGALAVLALRGSATAPVMAVLGVLAVLLSATTLADLPRRVTFDAEGLRRQCLLRDQRIPWASVVAVERLRPGLVRIGGRRGLVARGRRGRWLLTDRTETPAQHEALRRVVGAVSVRFEVAAPTWEREA